MSLGILGKQLDGIWHSGIAVFGVEYFYGGGICAAPAGRAIPHLPYQEIHLGETAKSQIELEVFLQSINSRFTQATYSLLRHNCNNFANEVAMFLLGRGIPDHIIRLPQEFLTSPMGAVLAPMIESMEQQVRQEMIGGGQGLNPFGHIQGRQRLFNEAAPSLSAGPNSKAITDDHFNPHIMNHSDTRLLRAAVDGIPSSLMSDDIKERVSGLDQTVIPVLANFMKEKFKKEKIPILMSFGTILRFFWKFETFRECFGDGVLIDELVHASMKSDNTHLIGTSLGLMVNITSTIPTNSSDLNRVVSSTASKFCPLNAQASGSSADMTLRVMINSNILELLPISEYNKREIFELLRTNLEFLHVQQEALDRKTVQILVQALEVCSKRINNSAISGFDLGETLNHEVLVQMAERIEHTHGLKLEQTLMLAFG